jgi:hypothetical protein
MLLSDSESERGQAQASTIAKLLSRESGLVLDVGVEDALLLQIMRHRILRQKRCLQADFSANPFSLAMGLIGRMLARATAAVLRAEVGALDLIKLPDLAPGFVADGSKDIDFKPKN